MGGNLLQETLPLLLKVQKLAPLFEPASEIHLMEASEFVGQDPLALLQQIVPPVEELLLLLHLLRIKLSDAMV